MDAKEFFGDWCEVVDFDVLNPILGKLSTIMQSKEISPAPENLFEAFRCCPYHNLKTVWVGLDPYPQKGIATGIAFGNKKDTPLCQFSPSLKVLYDATQEYCSFDLPFSTIDEVFPTLESWCNQGVLLLNSALSVEINRIGSHTQMWKPFISSLLTNVQKSDDGVVFVLLGEVAQSFRGLLDERNTITCVHPARCARTGEKFPNIFKQIDEKICYNGKDLIYWI